MTDHAKEASKQFWASQCPYAADALKNSLPRFIQQAIDSACAGLAEGLRAYAEDLGGFVDEDWDAIAGPVAHEKAIKPTLPDGVMRFLQRLLKMWLAWYPPDVFREPETDAEKELFALRDELAALLTRYGVKEQDDE